MPLEARAFAISSFTVVRMTAAGVRRQTFSVPSFRRLLFGQTVSLTGTWMQLNVIGWVILSNGGAAWLVGFMATARLLPLLVLTPWAGRPAERFGAVRAAAIAQLVGAGSAVVLMFLRPGVAMLVVCTIAGAAAAVEGPAVTSLVPSVLPLHLVTSGSGLLGLGVGLGRLTGAAAGGLVASVLEPRWCFAANAISFLFASTMLASIREREGRSPVTTSRLAGLRYIRDDAVLRVASFALALFTIAGAATVVAFPVMALQLSGGAKSLAALGALAACGDIAGAWIIAGRGAVHEKTIPAALLLAAIALLLLPLGVLGYGGGFLLGVASGVFYAAVGATFQLRAEGPARFSVFAAQSALAAGPGAVVGPVAGVVVNAAGLQVGALLAATGLVAVALVVLLLGSHTASERSRTRTGAVT